MATLDSFLSRLMPYVPGCSDLLAKQVLVDVAMDFCDRTNVVRVVADQQDVVAGVAAVDLDLPADTQLCRVLKAFYGTTWLGRAALEFVDSPFATFGTVLGETRPTGTPTTVYMIDDATLGLYPAPASSATGALSVILSVKPKPAATTLPDELFNHWLGALMDGAKARLYAVPDASFGKPPMIAVHLSAYHAAVSAARAEGSRGRIVSDMHVRPRPFA